MADTIANYTGNGTQTDFVVPFDYLKKSFVRVYLDSSTLLTGGDYGDTGADYYFLDKTTVRLKTAPADGVLVTIRRYTSATERIVSFKDASILKANDLDTSQLQSFHIAEEARDVINDALIKDEEGNWDAQGNRITNVGDPVDGKDAINLDWYNKDAGKVQQNRDESLQFRNEAEGFRNEAEQFKNQASSSASDAKAAEVAAEESASQAIDANSKAQQALTTVTGLQQQVAADADEVAANASKVNQQTIQVDSQHTEVGEWHTDVDTKHKDVVQKHTEVTDMYNDLMDNTQVIEDNIDAINTVSDNIEDVKNVSNNMPDIDIVSGDLEGTITAPKFTDMGRVGTGKTEEVTVTGGNIKIVADNIEDVQKVGDLIDSGQVDTVINAVETTAENVTKAKNWAEKTDAPVEGDSYSAKYWAQQASTVAGQSDWTETNDSSPAFIKNKPDLSIYALKTEISTIYRYKGTVATYDQLPVASQVIGDAYNIASDDKSHGIKAGDNVVWNGTYWDNLSGYVDLSPYLTSEAASGIYLRQDTASTTYATKTELSSYATKSSLSSYALKTEIPDVSGYQTIAQHNADIQELSEEIDGKMNKITDYGRVGT